MIPVRMVDFLKTGVFAGMALGTDHLTVKRPRAGSVVLDLGVEVA